VYGSHSRLAELIAAGAPRSVSIWGPPGHDKTAFLRDLADHAGRLTVCDLTREDDADLARQLFDALAGRDAAAALRSAADRLALRPGHASATSRDALRREWSVMREPHLVALRDPDGALASPAGADLLQLLVGALPAARTLAVVTRAPLPPALQEILASGPSPVVGPADLAFTPGETETLAAAAGLSPDAARAIAVLARGWPLVTRLLIALAARDDARTVLADAAAVPREVLFGLTVHRRIALLRAAARDALIVAALLPGATHGDLLRVLGDACDDVAFAELCALPFVERSGGSVRVHPEVVRLLRERFASRVQGLYEDVLQVLTGEGKYVEAAHVALGRRDSLRAAAVVDAAPSYFAMPLPLHEYERIIDRLDPGLVTRFPNLWIATIPYRNFAVDRATFVREAETVHYCLPAGASLDQRAATLTILANAYVNLGRREDGEQLIRDALQGFASTPSRARATVLNFLASLRGIEGRFTEARALASEAAGIARIDFADNQTLHYIEAHEATYRGRVERVVVIFDELLRRTAALDLPLHAAFTAGNAAFFVWANGADEHFERYLAAMEDALMPGTERGFAPQLDAARGRTPQMDQAYLNPVAAAIAYLYRMAASSDRDVALEAARAAARAADVRCDPYVQILAHAALYVLDASARRDEANVLRTVVAPVESPELHEAVEAIVAGRSAGVLEPFLRTRVLRTMPAPQPRLAVELFRGTATLDGTPLRLSDKEFELLAFLAAAQGPVTRDRIGEALWDHLDPEEWPNNLKVTLSRLRAKIQVRDAVVLNDGQYRLSPAVDVDLRRIEALVRGTPPESLDEMVRDTLQRVLRSYGAVAGRYERFLWMQSTVVRMDELVCRAGILVAEDALRAGRLDEALDLARQVEAIDPYDEAACAMALRAYRARGDADAARREFRRYATALANELGAAPSSRLAALAREPE
jgi:DNA-binding SARP family transcriptional activator